MLSSQIYASGVTSALFVFPRCLEHILENWFSVKHQADVRLWHSRALLKWSEVLTASLEGSRATAVEVFDLSCLASPGAPCSSPSGQSSQTLPPSRCLGPPAEAVTPGQSFFGPPCRELTAQPLYKDRVKRTNKEDLRAWTATKRIGKRSKGGKKKGINTPFNSRFLVLRFQSSLFFSFPRKPMNWKLISW